MLRNFTESQEERAQKRKSMPVVDIETSQLEWEDENGNVNTDVIRGLTQKEYESLKDVLFPNRNAISHPKSRIGPEGSLQKQVDHISETVGYTERELDRTSDQELREELQIRIDGLNEARELTRRRKVLDETRYQQEDISRLQKFKEWAKENLVGVSALAISVAGIVTTIIVGARKAIVKGAQATGKFGPLLGPLLNIVAQAISWDAKGLAYLSKNLWILALTFAWFIYDQYKQRRKK